MAVLVSLAAAGEAEVDLGLDLLQQRGPLGRLELLGVLLGVGQRPHRVGELLLHLGVDGRVAGLAHQLLDGELRAHPLQHVGLAGGTADLGRLLAEDRVGLGLQRRQATGLDGRRQVAGAAGAQLLGDGTVRPLGHAGLAGQLDLQLADLLDGAVRQLERLDQRVLVDLLGAGLDHGDGLGGAADDQVKRRFLQLHQRRVQQQLAVDAADADCADRAHEGQRRQHQRGGRAVHAEDVVSVHLVGRERGDDHLHLVLVALRPQRPDRPVDHARGQDRLLARPALALEKAARYLAGGVHLLFDVHGQREEVGARPSFRAPDRGRQDNGALLLDQHGAVRLLGHNSGLEYDLPAAHGDGEPCCLWLHCDTHVFDRPFLGPAGSPAHPLMGLGWPPLAAQPQLLDEGAIALQVVLLHVGQKPAPSADQLQQAAA